MIKLKQLKILLILFSLFIESGFAQTDIELKIGEKAPPLIIQEWIKGSPVSEFKKGRVYVVEFSGTWCPPCRKAIPHLSELARKYSEEVKVISVYNESINENIPNDLSYLEKIYTLVNAMGEKMDFTVAADVPQHLTKKIWRVSGVPAAYIVDENGRIAWKGHPVDLEPVLEQVVSGIFDSKITIQKKQEFDKEMKGVKKIAENGDYLLAIKKLDSLIGAYPGKTWLLLEKFKILADKDDKEAYKLVEWLLKSNIDGFDWLHLIGAFSFSISPANRNFQLELKAIDRTIEESETEYHKNFPLSQKAKTYMLMGEYDKAINYCRMAIECSKKPGGDKKVHKDYETDLNIYKYKLMQKNDTEKALNWLSIILDTTNISVDRVIHHLNNYELNFPEPDYEFALLLLDKLISRKLGDNAYLFNKKSIIYESKDDITKAIEFAEKAYEESKNPASILYHQVYIERYEKRLAELKAKVGSQ